MALSDTLYVEVIAAFIIGIVVQRAVKATERTNTFHSFQARSNKLFFTLSKSIIPAHFYEDFIFQVRKHALHATLPQRTGIH